MSSSLIFPTTADRFLTTSSFPKRTILYPNADKIFSRLFIFLFLQIVDIAIHFNNQPRLMTIKVDNESLNDLLSPKADSQLLGADFLPQKFFSRSHFAAEFFCALSFFLVTF